MRIELPLPSWNESTHRGDDDAHTLTVEPPVASEWAAWQWPAEPSQKLRVCVEAPATVPLTITL